MSAERIPWHQIVHHVAQQIDRDDYPSGHLAALRRLEPEAVKAGAFWQLMAEHAPELIDHDRALSALAAAIRCMAIMHPFHQPQTGQRSLGLAMAKSSITEQRLLRLLETARSKLPDELRRLAQLMASKGEPGRFDWTQGARLVWTAGTDEGERLRREIARDYYGAQYRQQRAEAA